LISAFTVLHLNGANKVRPPIAGAHVLRHSYSLWRSWRTERP